MHSKRWAGRAVCAVALSVLAFGANAVERAVATKHAVTKQADKHHAEPADQQLEGQVKAALFASIGNEAREVGIEVQEGFVLLSGAVRTEAIRERAEQAAARVLGVKSVDNALSVRRAG